MSGGLLIRLRDGPTDLDGCCYSTPEDEGIGERSAWGKVMGGKRPGRPRSCTGPLPPQRNPDDSPVCFCILLGEGRAVLGVGLAAAVVRDLFRLHRSLIRFGKNPPRSDA